MRISCFFTKKNKKFSDILLKKFSKYDWNEDRYVKGRWEFLLLVVQN